jgi:hypothetical protein
MVMSFSRFTFRTQYKVFNDSDQTVTLRWFFAHPDAKTFPYPHMFSDLRYERLPEQRTGLGQVYGAGIVPTKIPRPPGLLGQEFHGDPAKFLTGTDSGPKGPEWNRDALGQIPACRGPAPVGLTVKLLDGSVVILDVTEIDLDQAEGYDLNAPALHVAKFKTRGASRTQKGVVTVEDQDFNGYKVFANLSSTGGWLPALGVAGALRIYDTDGPIWADYPANKYNCDWALSTINSDIGVWSRGIPSVGGALIGVFVFDIAVVPALDALTDDNVNLLSLGRITASTRFCVGANPASSWLGADGPNAIGDQFHGGIYTGSTLPAPSTDNTFLGFIDGSLQWSPITVGALSGVLAPVAFSGHYADLTGKPVLGTAAAHDATDFVAAGSLATVATTGAYSDLSGTPTLATVATTGAYSDLSGKPTLAATKAAVASQWLHSYDASTGLFTATQPAYSDLTGTPTLAATKAAVASQWLHSYDASTGLFTASQPAYSDLSGTPTLATVATTGAYADLSGTPTLAAVATTGAYSDLSGTPTLATVATTGAYSDLTGKPTLAATKAAVASQWLHSYDASTGLFTATQPAESDISFTDILTNNATTGHHGFLPKLDGNAGHFLAGDGTWGTPSGSGTVTSVGASGPAGLMTWSAAITTAGTLTATLASQSAQTVFAGPSALGAAAAVPAFRALSRDDVPLPRGWIDGLTLALNATANKLDIAAGGCRDSTDAYNLALAGTFTKSLAANWAAGTGNGGLDTGSEAANTWYHVFLIRKSSDGTTDALFSLSATAPSMPTGYDLKRRIGSIYTGASGPSITKFKQRGDSFLWADTNVFFDINTTVGTTALLFTLTVPTGVQVDALLRSCFGNSVVLLSSPDEADNVPDATNFTFDGSFQGFVQIRTNTSAQVRARANGSARSVQAATFGWIDSRGKDA